jgi:L-seryl-tRNA(Ser) seleniumtransferase
MTLHTSNPASPAGPPGDPRRALPSVDTLAAALAPSGLLAKARTALARDYLARLRNSTIPPTDQLHADVLTHARSRARQRITPVINATGILLHTNLGRAPLGEQVAQRLAEIARGYSSLELDLNTGRRGSRGTYAEFLLTLLTDAPDATIVNNCAAALHLVLAHLTRDKPEVLIARDQLIQIGGGFRIPDILAASGAKLVEVGTTNHTALDDYRRALSPRTGLILKVHHSNFHITGFVSSPPLRDLAALAHDAHVPLVEDQGSGVLPRTRDLLPQNAGEPTPADSLRAGADLVLCSGDKFLAGPQAGLIVGNADLVSALKRHPLFRALRCDKLILAALETVIESHLESQPLPLFDMLTLSAETLTARANRILAAVPTTPDLHLARGAGEGQIGGGSLPQCTFPSITLDLSSPTRSPESLAGKLRNASPPIIAYITSDRVKLDLRTVLPSQDDHLITALKNLNI